MVFCILSLTTLPTMVRRGLRPVVVICLCLPRLLQLHLALAGPNPRDVLAHLAQASRVGQLARRLLEAHVEVLLPELAELGRQLLLALLAELAISHAGSYADGAAAAASTSSRAW